MKPDQIRERMELYGLGRGEREKDVFLREVCDAYEDLFYNLVEKEDKVNSLNDAVKYYKNMEDNMAQMLSTISQISEKTEKTAEKTAELTIREAEGKADMILADASQEAAQILEDAKAQAKEIVESADGKIEDSKKELEQVKEEIKAYAQKFYEFLEMQKTFFEEHKIDIESLTIQTIPSVPIIPVSGQVSQILPVQVLPAAQPSMESPKVLQQQQGFVQPELLQPEPAFVQPELLQQEPAFVQPEPLQQKSVVVQPEVSQPLSENIVKEVQDMPEVSPVLAQQETTAKPEEPAAITNKKGLEDVTINQIRKIPNTSVHNPTIEEIEARIPENIRNIPISDHTETLDEIIQSIKKSYEEVENR